MADNGKHLLGFDGGPEYVDVSIDQTIGQHGRQAELEQNPGSSYSHHVPHGQVLSQPCKMFSAFRCGSNILTFLRVDLNERFNINYPEHTFSVSITEYRIGLTLSAVPETAATCATAFRLILPIVVFIARMSRAPPFAARMRAHRLASRERGRAWQSIR